MKKWLRRLIWLIVLAGGGVLAYLYVGGRPVEVETAQLRRGGIEQYVAEDARTRLHTVRAVTALTSGIAERIELEEGDLVEAGQVLTTIEDTQMRVLLRQAEAQIDEVEGYLAGVDAPLPEESEVAAARRQAERAGVAAQMAVEQRESAEINLKLAREEFERARALHEKGVASRENLDRRTRDYEVAQRELAAAKLGVNVARIEQQVASLQAQVLLESMDDTEHLNQVYGARIKQTRAEIDLISNELAKTQVRSPIGGVMLNKLVDRRGYVTMGTELVLVGDPDSIEIESDILSDEIGQVTVGQQVRLEGQALGAKEASGRVKKIYPTGFTKVSALGVRQQRVKVLIEFDNSRLGLGPGYELDVKIVTDRRENAVLVPSAAVFATADGMAAFRVEERRAVLVPVRIGMQGDREWEVLEGLSPDDRVILHPPEDLEPGDPVQSN